MLTDPITLAGDSSSSRAYALRSIENGKSIRSVASPASPITAETLTLSSTSSAKGSVKVGRYLIRLDRTIPNSAATPVTASYYVVIEVPVDQVITQAIIKDMRTQMNNLLVDATLVKILNGEP
jgi:hypothetical protein